MLGKAEAPLLLFSGTQMTRESGGWLLQGMGLFLFTSESVGQGGDTKGCGFVYSNFGFQVFL